MTEAPRTHAAQNLAWLLDEFVKNVGARAAAVVTDDGFIKFTNSELPSEDAERLAAITAGSQSLATGAGRHFDGGSVRQVLMELDNFTLFIASAGQGALLVVLANPDANAGTIGYEMRMLAKRVGGYLITPPRSAGAAGAATAG